MTSIPPLNQNFPITDKNGYFTSYFKRFMDLLLARVGGIQGGNYAALPNTAGAVLWDLNASPVAVVTLVSGANILTIVNPVAGLVYPYRLTLIQPASGADGTVSWPTTFKWPAATPPTLSVTNGAVDKLWFDSDGTNMYGMVGENAFG